MSWRRLVAAGVVRLHARTLVRRLHVVAGGTRIERALAVRDARELEYRAKTFVIASGYLWSSHLLLLSADARHPRGLANSSGLVGKFVTGHRSVSAYIELPVPLYPGLQEQHSLVSKQFMRKPRPAKYLRHDLRIWEDTTARLPRLRNDDGTLLLGDALLADWRSRTRASTARVRGYYDVVPARESEITLDPARRTPLGDPLPQLRLRDDPVSAELRGFSEHSLANLMHALARAGDGKVLAVQPGDFQDHPGGGCRMGNDPASSVVDRFGRTHDHDNLFVVGAPTVVSSSCANGTLTFCALSLMAGAEIARTAA
jgi:quinoprotein glucose dehydrogenase